MTAFTDWLCELDKRDPLFALAICLLLWSVKRLLRLPPKQDREKHTTTATVSSYHTYGRACARLIAGGKNQQMASWLSARARARASGKSANSLRCNSLIVWATELDIKDIMCAEAGFSSTDRQWVLLVVVIEGAFARTYCARQLASVRFKHNDTDEADDDGQSREPDW